MTARVVAISAMIAPTMIVLFVIMVSRMNVSTLKGGTYEIAASPNRHSVTYRSWTSSV